jgi:hypothetical protein
MSMTRILLAPILLTACLVHSASAQSRSPALTNADVTRLAALHVSDQTVIAVINEANATHFDLSQFAVTDLIVAGVSTAVIATMRQPPRVAAANTAAHTGDNQTLTEAAAKAAATKAAAIARGDWTPVVSGAPTATDPIASRDFAAFSANFMANARLRLDDFQRGQHWVWDLDEKKHTATVDTTFFHAMTLSKQLDFVELMKQCLNSDDIMLYDATGKLLLSNTYQLGLHVF